MRREILDINHKNSLRVVSQKVRDITSKETEIINDLLETLRTSERPGVGLAAPQIGENVRIIVIESEGYTRENNEIVDKIPTLILINPEITKYSKEKVVIEEGCLSVPDLIGPVERPKKIKVNAVDENGKNICINASGFLARVIQHEIDHLNGVLFIDLVKDKSKLIKISDLNEDENEN